MTIFLILITIALGISLFSILRKVNLPKLEKVVKKISFYSLVGIIVCVILMIYDLRLKGKYTSSIIGMTFILSTILLYGLTKNSTTKVKSGIVTIPIFILGILSIFWGAFSFYFYIIIFPFQPPIKKFEINSNHNIEIRNGGFFACGESLVITKSTFVILDKEQYIGNSYCTIGIHKIETLKFKENKAEFLIYHNGEDKYGENELGNPYKYSAEIKNVW